MNYQSLRDSVFENQTLIQEYLNIITKHQTYFNDKKIDDFIKVRLVIDHEIGDTAKPGQMKSTTFFDVRILQTQSFPVEILAEMSRLTLPPVFVSAF